MRSPPCLPSILEGPLPLHQSQPCALISKAGRIPGKSQFHNQLKPVGGPGRSAGEAPGLPGLHPRQTLKNVLFIIFEFQEDAWAGTQLTKRKKTKCLPSLMDEGAGGSWRWDKKCGMGTSKVIQQPRQLGIWALNRGLG